LTGTVSQNQAFDAILDGGFEGISINSVFAKDHSGDKLNGARPSNSLSDPFASDPYAISDTTDTSIPVGTNGSILNGNSAVVDDKFNSMLSGPSGLIDQIKSKFIDDINNDPSLKNSIITYRVYN